MTTLQIDILNPKAEKLIRDLADLDLIAIKSVPENEFLKAIEKLRAKAAEDAPDLEEITAEVEFVRSERYANRK